MIQLPALKKIILTTAKFFFNLINGLEDVRQEQLLIERTSKNAKPLLVKLLNDMIKKGNGLPETNDFLNIPFTLAVEGRRLNGYKVDYDFDWSTCPWKEEIDCSLDALRSAKSTLDVTNIALTLWYSLEKYLAKGQLPDQPQEEGAEQSEEESQEDGQDDSQESGRAILRTILKSLIQNLEKILEKSLREILREILRGILSHQMMTMLLMITHIRTMDVPLSHPLMMIYHAWTIRCLDHIAWLLVQNILLNQDCRK